MTLADYSMLRPSLLAKLREFAGQLPAALHESRRRQAAIILREHALLMQLHSGGHQRSSPPRS